MSRPIRWPSAVLAGVRPARPEQRPVHLPGSAGQGVLLTLGPGQPGAVATLRGVAGRNPYDKRLTDLIGELSTRSERFRTLWAAHNVRHHRTGIKRLHHPVVGDLELQLRGHGAQRRTPDQRLAHLHRRTRHPASAARPRPPRQLGRHARPGARRAAAAGPATPALAADHLHRLERCGRKGHWGPINAQSRAPTAKREAT